MAIQDKLAVVDTLTEDVLLRLFKRDLIVVRVPNFYHPEYCAALAERVVADIDDGAGAGIYASNIDSFWAARRDKERHRRYFEHGIVLQRHMREVSEPHASPIDLLRLTLEESWPGGANLMRNSGRKAPFGISRLWREGSEGLPHQDLIYRETSAVEEEPTKIRDQIGVNVYLTTSRVGGELETWDVVIEDAEYEKIADRFEGSYGYTRDMLPRESIVIQPQVGDLIMINTACVHAIRKIIDGERLTISGFVGSAGEDQPLLCWS
ncbi:2OG-Fe(II)-dependent halogenase WelO5 family protein [Salinarimonas chemoclinalis]|uniref:2OG-Fe(II)-dependent halogenase WelO5 family protein n=1 Tax=Salinarimonas chemoclinalis TaxID=3241599 RepID=UPI003556459C